MTVRLEVRCCCSPKKLLGWAHVPVAEAVAGGELIASRPWRDLGMTVGPYAVRVIELENEQIRFHIANVRLEIETDPDEPHTIERYPAVKAEGYEGRELAELLAPWAFQPAP